jgi:tRNA-specific 2-thiouridylase
VGQRKGLPGGEGPLYVVKVDTRHNSIVAGPLQACETTRVQARDIVWHGDDEADVRVKVRARMPAVRARVVRSAGVLTIDLEEPVCAAPGQAAVCYSDDMVVGGGTIAEESEA